MGMDIREIQSVLPHRYPFLFIDRVETLDDHADNAALSSARMKCAGRDESAANESSRPGDGAIHAKASNAAGKRSNASAPPTNASVLNPM